MNLICTHCHYQLHPVYDPQLEPGHIQMLQCYTGTCKHQTKLSINVIDNSIFFYHLAIIQPNSIYYLKGAQSTNYTRLFDSSGPDLFTNKSPLVQVNFIPLHVSDYQQQAYKVFIKLLNLLPFS